MPIRINLMAEAQAAAEMRRKNPVKRAIWVGSFLVLLMIIWIGKLQMDVMFEKSHYTRVEGDWKAKQSKYASVTNNQALTLSVDKKLAALDHLHTNRFLWAPVLNALQKTLVDNVQVTRIRTDQTYSAELAHTIGSGASRQMIPAGEVERINLFIEAKDFRPGDESYTKYKENLGNFEFFVKHLGRRDGFVMSGTLGALTVDPLDPSKQFVTFTLLSHFPEMRRSE